MKEDEAIRHHELLSRFIEAANSMKKEGNRPELVSAALMSASAVYATYVAAGNRGYLEDSGIDKTTELYRQHLVRTRELRRAEQAGDVASGDV